LQQRGCQYIQGYLTGKPMAANIALAALRESMHAKMVPA
jgi:EAL domain-containing protein (putative c-di-GMP-specific phosphodiesterase class I)